MNKQPDHSCTPTNRQLPCTLPYLARPASLASPRRSPHRSPCLNQVRLRSTGVLHFSLRPLVHLAAVDVKLTQQRCCALKETMSGILYTIPDTGVLDLKRFLNPTNNPFTS